MKDNDIRNAFNIITAAVQPQIVVNRVRNSITEQQHTQKKSVFPLRTVVLVCILAAAAISVSAYPIYNSISLRRLDTGKPYAYEIIVRLEEDLIQLDEEVIEKLPPYNANQIDADKGIRVYDVGKLFNTWEEVQAWLKCDLLSSNLFENSLKQAPLCLLSNYSDAKLIGISAAGSLSISGTSASVCNLSVSIPLSADVDGYAFTSGNYSETINGNDEIIPYTSENGLSCDIILTKRQSKRQTHYNAVAYLYHQGAVYSFSIFDEDKNTAYDLMRQILDSLY